MLKTEIKAANSDERADDLYCIRAGAKAWASWW